jgi:hypothetical protein
MTILPSLVNRLGFENFAFNLLVNEIENGNLYDGYRYEQYDGSIAISSTGNPGEFIIAIRCYVPGRGWLSIEFNHKQ